MQKQAGIDWQNVGPLAKAVRKVVKSFEVLAASWTFSGIWYALE
jgi:hypothetical protein